MKTKSTENQAVGSMSADEVWSTDKAHVLHPWELFDSFEKEGALVISKGEGGYIYDAHGKRYFDAVGGLWCTNIGLGRAEMSEAIAEQVLKLAFSNTFTDMTNEPSSILAKKLVSLTPDNLNHLMYSCGGSTANDTAVRLIHFYQYCRGKPEKKHLIARKSGYHGSTFMAMSLTGKAGDKIPNFKYEDGFVHHISSPNYYRGAEGVSVEEFCNQLIDELEQKILEIGSENVAAFFAEPVLGAGGVIVPPEGYNRKAWEICKKHDVLYVSDEVVTGFGRLGNWFSSESVFGIKPDIITCAKGLTSGYLPLGATIYSDEIHEVISSGDPNRYFAHGFTYSGHPVSCAAALKNIEIIEHEKLMENVLEVGPYFKQRLEELRKYDIVGDVRGMSFMMCIEFVKNKTSKEMFDPALDIGKQIANKCEEKGLIVRPIVHLNIMSPALTMSRTQVDFVVETLARSIGEVTDELIEQGIKIN